jgi:hypothetical protein
LIKHARQDAEPQNENYKSIVSCLCTLKTWFMLLVLGPNNLREQNNATAAILRQHHYCFVFRCSLVGGGGGGGNNFELQTIVIRKLAGTQMVQEIHCIL